MPITQRLCGAAAVAGGALWIVFAVLAAGLPEGCVGDACRLSSHRELGDLGLLLLAGAGLVLVGYAGLRPPLASRVAVIAGVALIAAGATSEELWTPLVLPGIVACVAGFALAGMRLAPRWIGVFVVAGSLGLLAANDQDARVLLLIPFAVAWMAAGVAVARPYAGTDAGERDLRAAPAAAGPGRP
jgi:hypothetical protein